MSQPVGAEGPGRLSAPLAPSKTVRLGRPPASDSAETRKRILMAGRLCFGRLGYSSTTNRHIAEAAGITTGAIYHYFPSKQELFAATYREVHNIVFEAFSAAAAGQATLMAKMTAFLDCAVELHAADPSLAAFASVSPLEVRRHPELQEVLGSELVGAYPFFRQLVADNVHELAPGVDPDAVVNFLVAAALGLAQFAAVSDSVETHRRATQPFKQLIEGRLLSGQPSRRTRSLRRLRS